MNVNNKKILVNHLFFIALGLLISNSSYAENYVIDQKNKTFSKSILKIKKGDVVDFRNSDRFFHNVYSLSTTKTFDLGSYPKGQSKSVTFDKTGVVEIKCAIHPQMKMQIEVTE